MQVEKTPYDLGLDIGIASVGWCILDDKHIIDLGVRTFDKAETAKEGEALNLARRTARLTRRRLHRRAWRLTKLARLLKKTGLIQDTRLFSPKRPFARTIATPSTSKSGKTKKESITIWHLRKEGLDRLLDAEEWALVLYHLCKHRGFYWISKAEEKTAEADAKGEGGKVKQGLANTEQIMKEDHYRTAAEMVLAKFPEAQRNKHGEYTKALSRKLLADELEKLFNAQRRLGNPFATNILEGQILGNGDRKSGLFWMQKPALSGAALLQMLGKCTFEIDQYRAPKASFTAERHVWLTRLNNLRLIVDGKTRPLNSQERAIALPLPYQQASDLTYRQLKTALDKAGLIDKEQCKFTGLSYPSEKQKTEEKAKDPENSALIKIPGWQTLRTTLSKAGLETEWESIAGVAFNGQPELLDKIALILSVYKEDEEAHHELAKLALPSADKMIGILLGIRFDKFHALSLKALYKIVPLMEQGLRYDEACLQAGYHHSMQQEAGSGTHRYLPPFYAGRAKDGRMLFPENEDIPRNPVVLRALNQARKVVNSIIRRYGPPMSVNIEMARDLSHPLDERRKIEKEQLAFRSRNEKDREEFKEQFNLADFPKGSDFLKWQLYREQHGKCLYSLQPIDIDWLLRPGYVEVDHALPYSRSYDDSKNNKVLVLKAENQNKGNRTPYEYLGGAENSPRWLAYAAYVESNKMYRQAKRNRLLRKDFGGKEAEAFRERNLNDTRYICKFFKNYVERHLKLAEGSQAKRCVVLSGQMTAFLRHRWGLAKDRAQSDRHHALDAAVIAACTHGMVKRLSDYTRRKELKEITKGFVDLETGEMIDPAQFQKINEHFPDPWSGFRHELKARLEIDNPAQLREEMARLGTYSEAELARLKPLFVSRAVQRRNGGAAHKETIYSQPERLKAKGEIIKKVALSSLTLKDLENLIDPPRNEKLYAAIRNRLMAHDGKADKAFTSDNPLRKPDKDGKPTGPIVKSVKVVEKQSGIPIRGGIAANDSMLRVDIFAKNGKYFLIPVYVHHRVTGMPNHAIIQGKDESEWTPIDETFNFCFSLHPNDLVKVTKRDNSSVLGYYRSCHSGTGAINIALHDRYKLGLMTTSLAVYTKTPEKPIPNDKLGLIEGVGVKTALSIEKFHVDVLGDVYPASPEVRRELA